MDRNLLSQKFFGIKNLLAITTMLLAFSLGNAQNFLEDFGTGPDTQDISPATTTYKKGAISNCPPERPNDGKYIVTANAGLEADCKINSSCGGPCNNRSVGDLFFTPDWHSSLKDHTGNTNGRFLIVNGSVEPGEFYKRTVTGMTAGNDYYFSAWVANILNPATGCSPASPVNIDFEIYNGSTSSGTPIASISTGDITASTSIANIWKEYGIVFAAPSSTFTLVMRNGAPGGCGNDLALDDISFTTCSPIAPTVSGSGPTETLCASPTATANLVGTPVGGSWNKIDGPGPSPTANTANVTVAVPEGTTRYQYVLPAIDGCTLGGSSDIISVVASASARPTFTLSAACDEITVSNASPAGGTFSFSPAVTDGALINSSNGTITNGTHGTTYSVIYTVGGSCGGTSDPMTADYIGTPVAPTVTTPVNYCKDATAVALTAKGAAGSTLNWYTVATGGTGTTSAPIPVTTSVGSTSYYVSQTVNGCESQRTEIVVQVGEATATVANPASTVIDCSGTPITLDGSGSSVGQYQWQLNGSDIPSATNYTYSASTAGNYTLKVTDAGGCTDTSVAITITVNNDLPNPAIANPATLTCNVNSVTLNGSSSTPAPSATVTYTWREGNDGTGTVLSTGNDALATQQVVTAAGDYTLTIANSATGCTNMISTTVSIDKTAPTVTLGDPSNTLSCTVKKATIASTGSSSGANFTYSWTDSNNNEIETGSTLTATSADTYTLTITNTDNGCTASASKEVTSTVGDPVYVKEPHGTLNCSVTTVVLDVSNSTTTHPDGITYSWATTDGNILSDNGKGRVIVDAAGTYEVTLTTPATVTCPVVKPIEVKNDSTPSTAIIAKSGDLSCSVSSVLLDGAGSDVDPADAPGKFTYQWFTVSGGVDTPIAGATNIQYLVDAEGTYAMVVTNTQNSCTKRSNEVTVDDNSITIPATPDSYTLCNTGTDDVSLFALKTRDDTLTGGNISLNISYHATQDDANNNVSPLNKNGYQNTSNPQTVYARIFDADNCSGIAELTLNVNNGPATTTPPALEYCDPNGDGFGVFTLGDADVAILNGVADLTLTYHETHADAVDAIKPLSKTALYSNRDKNIQTIYARVENQNGCYIIVDQKLKVIASPRTEKATKYILCDINSPGDNKEGFDLTSKESEVLKNLNKTLHTVSYYQSLSNAEAGTSAIANKTNYTNQSVTETIYMKVTETATGCSSIEPIELEVAQRPVVVEPALYVVCDENKPGDGKEIFDLKTRESEITGATTIPMEVTYYKTLVDAENKIKAIANPASYTNSTVGAVESVHVRVENPTTGCYSTTILDIRVDPLPSPKSPVAPLISCDADADGFAVFPLETLSTEIADKDGANVKISYHETQADALIVANAIAEDPTTGEITYKNIQNAKNGITIYAAAKHNTTGCVRVVPVTLRAEPSPQVPVKLDPLEECDDLSTGKQNDGLAQFDLTQHEAAIYANQNKTNLEITYHISEADAANNVNPIADPKNYENTVNQVTNPSASPQQIWAALRNTQTDCSRSIAITLKVNPQPEPAKSIEYSICDDETKDEKTTFDLTSQISLITKGATKGYDLLFYETEADAKSGSNANIKNPIAYENTINKQTIYVRVIDQDSKCAAISNLTLRVNNNPTPEQPAPLETCDKDDASTNQSTGDGIALFDLTERQIEIENQEGSVSLSYYTTEASAKEGGTENQITTPTAFPNTDLYEQTIYVRAEYDLTGCSSVVPLELKVLALPEPSSIPDYVQCSLNNDGSYAYDLQEYNATILGGSANVGKYELTYYGTEAAAEAGAIDTQLNSPYVSRGSATSPEEVWVRIQQKDGDCYVTRNFNLVVGESINLKAHDDIEACGTPATPGSSLLEAEIDLTQYETAILNGLDASIHSFSYYKVKNNDKLSQPIADPTKYVNSSNQEKIYIKVTRADGCEDTRQELNLEVKLKPEPKPDPEYIICSDPDTGILLPGSTAVIDTKLVEATHTFEWKLDGQIITGATGSKYTAIAPGKYTVVATSRSTPCASDEIAVNVVLSSQATIVKAYTVDPQFSQDSYTVKVEVIGSGDYEYQIDGGPFQDSPYFENVAPGLHQVGVQDKRGCQGLPITANLYATTYMKYFTPNGDGINDEWHIVGLESQSNARVYIYDRYGKLLKEMQVNEEKGWDGTFRGNPMPATDYWFRVQFEENKEIKEFRSHFTLKR
ncbi:MAG: T9SS type B sorting domain-containing protein [Flavobacteriales bacterium]|nr:T9SS type B sorting domain-containing protein [Flavobacteriales bacterium]